MSAYNKLLKNNGKQGTKGKNRITTQSEDSDIQERTQHQNVFLQSSQQYIGQYSRMQRNLNSSKPIVTRSAMKSSKKQKKNPQNMLSLNESKQNRPSNNKMNEIELVDDEQVPQGEDEYEAQENTQLSLLESYKYYTGQLTHNIKYPLNKIIAINNNNDEQNSVNRKILKSKKKHTGSIDQKLSQTNQYYFTNSLKVSSLLLIWHVVFTFLTTCWQWYLYIGVMIANFLVQRLVFMNSAQYVGEPYILLVVSIVYMVGYVVFELMIVKNRRGFDQGEDKFKVYYHDGVAAEWNMIQGAEIRAGHVYKVPAATKFPTDAILLHSTKSIIQVDEKEVKSLIPEPIFTTTIKQTIIKSPTIVLPISGMLQYTIDSAQQRTINWFEGSLRLEEPITIKHNVGVDNFVYRNSVNLSGNQVLCMALEVGSSSIQMKNVEYPHLWKDNEYIFQKHPQLMTIRRLVFYFLLVACIGYLVLSAIGLLIGYLTNEMTKNHYYLGEQVKILHLLFYHFTNFVIFIPIFANFSVLCYTWMMGKLTQSNISSRRFQFSQTQVENAISHSCGNIAIKDYSIIPYLNNPTTLVTGIEIFKEKKSFALKKIIVKQTKFNFDHNKIQDDLFDEQQKNLIKSFMTVTLLTTTGFSSKTQNISFQSNIRKMAKQHLSLKLNQQKDIYSVTGPLQNVFTNGKLQVIPYFIIKGCKQHPYMISFYEIPAQNRQENPQRRVLCLLRGDPETVLMKAYGKKINLLNQSERLHQDQGLQVQFVGKFTIFFSEAQNLKDSYESATMQKNKFYQLLQPLIKKIQPMGLLAFQNEYSQSMISSIKNNPFLNLSMLNKPLQSSLSNQQKLSSQSLPNIILICPSPGSYCLHPEFQSVNTINKILGNPLLFNFQQKEIGDKILYDPIPVDEMVEKLNRQRVIVFNGWDMNNIVFMLNGLKEKGLMLTGIIQKQQQLYLAKLCDYSIGSQTKSLTNDISKYTDFSNQLSPTTPKTMKFLSLIQLFTHDSHVVYNRLYYIVLVHIVKFICYFVVEAINFYFTLGSGVSLMRLPLYIVTEIIVLFDIVYYLNVKDGVQVGGQERKLPSVLLLSIKTTLMCIAGTIIIIFSSITPHTQQGTPTNSVFTLLHIHLYITHLIIFSKLTFNQKISWWQIIILIIQLSSYYVGILIISEISLYEFNKVFMHMFDNKLFLVSVVCVWVYVTIGVGQVVVEAKPQKKKQENKYQQIKRVNKETNFQVIEIEQV